MIKIYDDFDCLEDVIAERDALKAENTELVELLKQVFEQAKSGNSLTVHTCHEYREAIRKHEAKQ